MQSQLAARLTERRIAPSWVACPFQIEPLLWDPSLLGGVQRRGAEIAGLTGPIQAWALWPLGGLKNSITEIAELEPYFDWALNEECFQYDECELLQPFIAAGKAVLQVEYALDTARFCPAARQLGFASMKKRLDLDAWRQPC